MMLFYDRFYRIIILCIWCNRICWHDLMLKKHIIFQIPYIIVGPLSNASFSTKSLLLTNTVCSDWPTDTVHRDWPNTTSTCQKWMNEWNNEWINYAFLQCFIGYCCAPKVLYNRVVGGGGGLSPQPPPVCSIHLDDTTAATAQPQWAHNTPVTGGDERES